MAGFGAFLDGLFTAASGGLSMAMPFINKSWQDKENDLIRAREDTAVQRRAADLEAAGLSKTLAAGNAATTSVTSVPEFKNNAIQDALSAAANIQGIRNAREENANMRKSRDVMNADIALKYGQMQKSISEANYFKAQANNSMIQGQLMSAEIAKFYQDIAESQERSKGYKYSAGAQDMLRNKYFWDAVRQGQEIDLINSTGQNSSVGGLGQALIRAFGQMANNAMAMFKVGNQYSAGAYHNNFEYK